MWSHWIIIFSKMCHVQLSSQIESDLTQNVD